MFSDVLIPTSVQCCISYRPQSFDLLCKSNDRFLCKVQHWAGMSENQSDVFHL